MVPQKVCVTVPSWIDSLQRPKSVSLMCPLNRQNVFKPQDKQSREKEMTQIKHTLFTLITRFGEIHVLNRPKFQIKKSWKILIYHKLSVCSRYLKFIMKVFKHPHSGGLLIWYWIDDVYMFFSTNRCVLPWWLSMMFSGLRSL